MGLLRDMWRFAFASPTATTTATETEEVVIEPATPEERDAAAKQLAQYFLERGFEGDKLFAAMVDAEANTGVRVSEIDRALDELKWDRENPVKIEVIDPQTLTLLDLHGVPSTRMRIKGSANWVTDQERSEYGGTEYLLLREPENQYDKQALAIYGRGRKVGYVSASKAAALAPILDSLPFDAFSVGGTSVIESSIRLWVDVPKVPDLRKHVTGTATAAPTASEVGLRSAHE
jgi:hypothetical protein